MEARRGPYRSPKPMRARRTRPDPSHRDISNTAAQRLHILDSMLSLYHDTFRPLGDDAAMS